ncbi:MAG: type II toxin-antitoxin system VapC family toxin [Chloroflexia bacterium]|nr:type II toxin-antitoxin system VapC family toxin [Chloroflexia bacterium]
MAGLTETLARHRLVGLDTAVFIYLLEDVPPYAALARSVLESIASGAVGGVTSALSLMELAVKPLRAGRADLADEYEARISGISNLLVAELDRTALRRAAEIRASYRLQPADALRVGACLRHGATAFLTNDRDFRRLDEIDVILLSDYLEHDGLIDDGQR